MNTIIWTCKVIFKLIIIVLLLGILHPDSKTYDTVLMCSVIAAAFSSIPYSKT